ncbi:hypothetical protein IEO21_05410 [Rhodonia placenta]|uniref:Sister chromatid cohesion protein DCC1 n=1 Tax=Rhodonia placenta TaxID=104341 RepID=A0A8H7P1Y1_9APHY|nr:hypothetical protein IEO21_05410 [Postia placenta]
MAEFSLQFSSTPLADTSAFRLLELPPELCKIVEEGLNSPAGPSLVIKGNPDEDAVLCTADKTYTIRSVVLSNSVLVATPDSSTKSQGDADAVVIRDQLKEILELAPSLPRLRRLDALLKDAEYNEGHEDEDGRMSEDEDSAPKVTYAEARETLQASDIELDRGLRDRRVLILGGYLRRLAPSYLTTILELLLTNLVSLSLSHEAASVVELCSALDGHDVSRDVCRQVMAWFGEVADGKWKVNVAAAVKEVGLGILRAYKDDPIAQSELLAKWCSTVGDTFESTVSLDLLAGNYLVQTDTLKDPPVTALAYFPSSQLPVDPAARFTDLFLTRPRWKADEIVPFLADIVVDSKERDKLLLKYTRTITNTEGIWYTARAKYNG